MRRPPPARRSQDFAAMTSMIDVVFFLLCFLVVTAAGGIGEMVLPANLSSSGSIGSVSAVPAPQTHQVEIWLKLARNADHSGTEVDMNGTVYQSSNELTTQLQQLAQLDSENPIYLSIQHDVPLEEVVKVYDACQTAGFESVNFAVAPPQ